MQKYDVKEIMIKAAIITGVSRKTGEKYRALDILIPIPGQEPHSHRIFLDPVYLAMLDLENDITSD